MTATTILLYVFSNIREVRKVGECANDVQCFLNTQVGKQCIQRTMRGPFAMKAHRLLPDRFHLVERDVTALRTNHIAEQSPEQPGVCLERRVFICEIGSRR